MNGKSGEVESRAAYFEPRWYAAWTRARHEKCVAEQLSGRSIEAFLPLYPAVHRWRNGLAHLELPLFPGYLFVRIALRDQLPVLQVPGVVRLVGFSNCPAALPQEEIERLRKGLGAGARAEPHACLSVGQRVQIVRGAFAGLEGILLHKRGRLRVVVSVELIQRAMAVDVDVADVAYAGGPLLADDFGSGADRQPVRKPRTIETGRSKLLPFHPQADFNSKEKGK
jgi:transcription antitermination factor NusG